jgi:hypothetical protein
MEAVCYEQMELDMLIMEEEGNYLCVVSGVSELVAFVDVELVM